VVTFYTCHVGCVWQAVQILEGVSEIEIPPLPFWGPETEGSSGTSTPVARSSLASWSYSGVDPGR
jgi:hypothetical protein